MLLAVWGFRAVEITKLGGWREAGGSGGYKGDVSPEHPSSVLLGAWRLPHSPVLLIKTGSRQGSRRSAIPLTEGLRAEVRV